MENTHNHREAGSSCSADILSRIALNDNKAGMEGLDREKINKIILESSKGSRFYENELKRERQVNQRVEKILDEKAQITDEHLKQAGEEVDRLTAELERTRELDRVIVHVDMDAFYAAVEMRDCPVLLNKPMAVGSMSMLSTSNYHARRFGVRAAMPGFIAKKLCPNLVIVPPNFDKYKAVSAQVRKIFSDYDHNFLPVSLDEAYLDITKHLEERKHWPETMRTRYIKDDKQVNADPIPVAKTEKEELSPVLFEDSPSSSPSLSLDDGKAEVFGTSAEEAVREMRFRIEQTTALTASAGIAPNMMLAKVCSDMKKPNGQYRIPPDRQVVMTFMKDLAVRKVSGIGKVTEKMLAALGIVSCSQLGQKMALLSQLFSETSWHHFLHISLGLGSTHIERDSERKSMSTERTFVEMSRADEQFALCRELCHDLAQDLQKEGLKGKTVSLKLKNVNFEVKTKAFTLQHAVCTEEDIFAVAKDLLKAEIDSVSPQPLKLRLMGVRVSSFTSLEDKKPHQRSIMGFLQKGGSDPSRLVCSESALKPEDDATKPSRRQHHEKTPQHQSFFQRAQSRRLQQQQEQEQSATTSQLTPRTATVTTQTQPDTASSSKASQPKDSTLKSFKVPVMPCFTCPVCNKETKAVNLTAFNHHIDECLKASAGLNQSTERRPSAEDDKGKGEKMDTLDKEPVMSVKTNLSAVKATCVPATDDHSRKSLSSVAEQFPVFESCRTQESQTATEHLSDLKGLSLTCPVCSQAQSTDDLALFNRHVDMCLNQEVLQTLGGSHSNADLSDAPTGKVLDEQEGTTKVREKSKRDGPSSLPPSKKAKVLRPKYTITKFFKDTSRQDF